MYKPIFHFGAFGRAYKCFTLHCTANTLYWLPSSLCTLE